MQTVVGLFTDITDFLSMEYNWADACSHFHDLQTFDSDSQRIILDNNAINYVSQLQHIPWKSLEKKNYSHLFSEFVSPMGTVDTS